MTGAIAGFGPGAIRGYNPAIRWRDIINRARTPATRSTEDASWANADWGPALARRFVEGDDRAVRAVERFVAMIVSCQQGHAIPHTHRDDVVQETLLSLLRAIPSTGYEFRTGFQAFVRHVAHARCVDWIRRQRDAVSMDEALPAPAGDPADPLIEADRRRLMAEVLRRIGPANVELIRLHAIERVPWSVIAERLGRSEKGLRVRMCRCLKQARTISLELSALLPRTERKSGVAR